MSHPISSPAMFLPKSLPLRELEPPKGWRQNEAGLLVQDFAASDGYPYKPAATPEVVNWQQEFEQSQQRRAANDAILKDLDEELEVKIAKLKAETDARKKVILAKIVDDDRARLRHLLARLEAPSEPIVRNAPGSEGQDGGKFETAKAMTPISFGHTDMGETKYKQDALKMETPFVPYLCARVEEHCHAEYPYDNINDPMKRQQSSRDRYY
ncbi:hypothetical protein MMC22_005785 [Lobaria immixta]|nr:hypothetical protein [Lobaria immixta]